MIFLIKSFLFFSLSFFILTFQYGGKSFFHILQSYTGPLGAKAQESLASNFQSSVKKSKGLLTGEPPKTVEDKVKSIKSSVHRSDEDVTDYDKKRLEKFLKKTTP